MSIFNFFKKNKDYENIIYVLERLLNLKINGEAIHERRNIDLSLYRILNSKEVNQKIIHSGCLPIVREGKKASMEFLQFVNNLSVYMEYDINTDFLWSKLSDNPIAQENMHKKMISIKEDILQYLLDSKLVSEEQYSMELTRGVKSLTE